MKNSLAHRTASTLAMLASLVFLSWPAIVLGDCCGEREAKATAVDAEQTGDCCQNTSACCSKPKSAEPHTTAWQPTVELGGCCRQESGQGCGIRCCRGLTTVALHTVNSNEVSAPGFLLAETHFEFPGNSGVRSDNIPDPPQLFLQAQDHCAQICRWLK